MAVDPLSLGLSLIPSLYKAVSGIGQTNRANKINPTNPGYQTNTAVTNNARVLGERANNYILPGYNQAVNNIDQSANTAFNQGIQGATSGGDVLDLATKIAYGQGQNLNDLAVQSAQSQDQALLQSLNADALAGQELVNKNAYDRDIYQQQLREKGALTQAGNTNIYGALDDGMQVITSALSPTTATSSSTSGFTPEQIKAYNQFRARRAIA